RMCQWYRRQRPETYAVCFDWPNWDEVGMAVRPESKAAIEAMGLPRMPTSEGVNRLIDELLARPGEGEVCISDLGLYCRSTEAMAKVVREDVAAGRIPAAPAPSALPARPTTPAQVAASSTPAKPAAARPAGSALPLIGKLEAGRAADERVAKFDL